MGKTQVDGVVEAVHYNAGGQIQWVRVYQRRGPIYTDRILLDREHFIQELKAGKHYFSGQRILLKASTFELGEEIRLSQENGRETVVIGSTQGEHDQLTGVPII